MANQNRGSIIESMSSRKLGYLVITLFVCQVSYIITLRSYARAFHVLIGVLIL